MASHWTFAIFVFIGVVVAYTTAEPVFCNSTHHAIPEVGVAEGFCPVFWAQDLKTPRGVVVVSQKDVLVVERGASRVTVLWDDNKDGYSSADERAVLASQDGLNHGIAVDETRGWLYASTSTQVYRWAYKPLQRTPLGQGTLVVSDIPCCGHVTRTLLLTPAGDIYVTTGSQTNVDQNDLHARLHLFTYAQVQNAASTKRPLNWNQGITIARGLRNEVGLTLDAQHRLWGVENGVDNLKRPELMDDLSFNNPAEELNLFENPDKFYGYPYCWSEGIIPPPKGKGTTTQWAQPEFMAKTTDAWCQNPQNVVAPKFGLPAHTAPMDIKFYYGDAFPAEYNTSAFVSLHGSWNRATPQGFAVVLVHFNSSGMPVKQTAFLYHTESHINNLIALNEADSPAVPTAADIEAAVSDIAVGEPPLIKWMHRPVGLGFGLCGSRSQCVYVSSDASGVIMAVAHDLK
eukprot:TRINITY_DN1106_c0_g1_i1.p1 TRINITY_DN1106_c0_g1~~TRINITY_DN1106_c0_g1_i1.p1  ORF type:complete len:458 (-),score=58.53 TRINITY_DN1106_c0_g1_i1:56-1429(-)